MNNEEKETLDKQARDAVQLAFAVPGQGVAVTPSVAKRLGFFLDNAVLSEGELEDHFLSLTEDKHGH
jgi:hypothetical protein